jgi:PAS domain S-box-containing protein
VKRSDEQRVAGRRLSSLISERLFGKPGPCQPRLKLWRAGKDHPIVVATALLAIVVQSGLIGSLLINRARRRHSEQALLESEERYRNVIESQTDMVCRFLADTTLTFVNEAYCRFVNRSREELVGRKFVELIPPEWHQQIRETVSALASKREVIHEEHEVFLPDGTVVWQHWENHPIINLAGAVQEYQGIGHDITTRKRMEELTRNLMHSSRLTLLGELTASIGHEINQPLGAILSNADAAELLLERHPIPVDEIRRVIADIRKDDLRANEIIRQIRAFLSQRQANLVPLDLNEMARDVVYLVESEARERNVVIEAAFNGGIPPVLGDRVQLQQALLNFILNGMDAMDRLPPSQRRIMVRTTALNGSLAQFSVSDHGHGIPEDRLPRIFESFFTTKKDGMGLGLAITQSIAEAHRGSVSAENNPGKGATFRFTLPTAQLGNREEPSGGLAAE